MTKGIKGFVKENQEWKKKKTFKHSLKTKIKISGNNAHYWKGKKRKPFSEEWKRKMKQNNAHYWKGKKRDKITLRKISINNKGKHSTINNAMWKGDKAKKSAFHTWLRRNKPKPILCEFCGKKRKLELANIKNHQYTRNPDDYRWLCRFCHRKLDNLR